MSIFDNTKVSLPPPPPPPPPPLPSLSCPSFQETKLNPQALISSDQSKVNETELDLEVQRLLCTDEKFSKTFFMCNTCLTPQLQDGPKCGLVALSIASSAHENIVDVNKIFEIAISLGFTKQGEIFNTTSLALLAEKCCNFKTRIIKGGLSSHLGCIIRSLLKKNFLLVPYDADFNHSPCCKEGFKAHWAVITGFVIVESTETAVENNDFVVINSITPPSLCDCTDNCTDPQLPLIISFDQGKILIRKTSSKNSQNKNLKEGKIYLIGMQGKSRHIGLWLFDEMARSNNNLVFFSTSRYESDYILPKGGLEEGLKGKAIILS